MRGTFYLQRFILFLLAVGVAVSAMAGEPTDQIKETTDKIISILTDPDLKDSARNEEKKKLIRQAVDERFDWEELARRSLARHWSGRTDEEKREFVSLFSDLLEKTYMDKVDSYSGETVFYMGETVDGNYGVVNIKIVTERNTEIPAEYRVKKKENGWFIYDISVNGVSLVNNYRTQFNSIILKSSYEDLVGRLKAKVAQR
ncbi:MAG: ABC transporter substrate-binding protein [Proteobacteria bacterium]|nr:ABC transporter substrate-binding protein [Pseudomonadota bacterium]NIS70707.1 ABC transporter substrate-binding protein [Pseudomonadota bacterium]